MTAEQDLEDALDAVEMMVTQYLDGNPQQGYDHMFMSAGENACEVLSRLRPQEWRLTPTGMMPAEPRTESPRMTKNTNWVAENEESSELKQVLDRAMERAVRGLSPDPDHFVVSYLLDGVAALERHSTMSWAFSAVHHFIVSGADWVHVKRIDEGPGHDNADG